MPSDLQALKAARQKKTRGLQQLEASLAEQSASYQLTSEERESYLLDLQSETREYKRDIKLGQGRDSDSEHSEEETSQKSNQPTLEKFLKPKTSKVTLKKTTLDEDLFSKLDTISSDEEEDMETREIPPSKPPVPPPSLSTLAKARSQKFPSPVKKCSRIDDVAVVDDVSDDVILPLPTTSLPRHSLSSSSPRTLSPPSLPLPPLSPLNPKLLSPPSLLGKPTISLPPGPISAYVYDVYEENNVIFLFSKISIKNSAVSCVFRINDAIKNIYIESSQNQLAEQQIKTIASKFLTKFSLSSTQKINCFGEDNLGSDLPRHYYVISYSPHLHLIKGAHVPYNETEFKKLAQGPVTFSSVTGPSVSLIEEFVLQKDLRGAQWVTITAYNKPSAPFSFSALEFDTSMNFVTVDTSQRAPPLLSTIFLSFRSVVDTKNTHVPLAFTLNYSTSLTEQSKPKDQYLFIRPLTSKDCKEGFVQHKVQSSMNNLSQNLNSLSQNFKVIICKDEGDLIKKFIEKFHSFDPDVVVGHALVDFLFPIIFDRVTKVKEGLGVFLPWSKLGRLKRGNSELKKPKGRKVFAGRLIMDTLLGAREFVTKVKSFDLTELSRELFNENRPPSDSNSTRDAFLNNSLKNLSIETVNDAILSFKISKKLALPALTLELSNLTGATWNDVLMMGRSKRIEWLLLHKFKGEYLLPERQFKSKKEIEKIEEEINDDEDADPNPNQVSNDSRKRKPTYTGGLVLEPQKGLYTTFVLVLDFLSLYPSIIREFDVCFTTMKRVDSESVVHVGGGKTGLLPSILHDLVNRRKEVKRILKQKSSQLQSSTSNLTLQNEINQLDIEQLAIKLVANSMYGCLGFSSARFYARPLASFITNCGRNILQTTINKCRDLGYDVIYGDTDSVMVNSKSNNYQEALVIADKIVSTVNNTGSNSYLELELDYVFSKLLLLKKKKYAAITCVFDHQRRLIAQKQEYKGIDLVRRDWCKLTKTVSQKVLEIIFTANTINSDCLDVIVSRITDCLSEVAENLRNNRINILDLAVNKELQALPEKYANPESQPHVMVALRMRARGIHVGVGTVIPYVISTANSSDVSTSGGLSSRARLPEEILEGTAEVDVSYYLKTQILAPIARLCEVIEGLQLSRLADALGVQYHLADNSVRQNVVDPSITSLVDVKIVLKCKCGKESDLILDPNVQTFLDYPGTSTLGKVLSTTDFLGGKSCENCSYKFTWFDVQNSLQNLVKRSFVQMTGAVFECSQCLATWQQVDPGVCTCESGAQLSFSAYHFNLILYFVDRFLGLFGGDPLVVSLKNQIFRLQSKFENWNVDASVISTTHFSELMSAYNHCPNFENLM
ncbi:hypothetical protein RCL1_002464 [Eukaryota sp. TZLM3-RCL]